MTKSKFLLALLATLISGVIHAQTASLSGLRLYTNNITPIMEGKETKGYTVFYKSDKADKGNDIFSLSIYDENLALVKTEKLKRPKNKFMMIGNAYNGKEIGFYFYNIKEEKFEIEAYDMTLNKVGSRNFNEEATNVEKAIIQQRQMSEDKDQASMKTDLNIYAVPNKGFVRNGILKGGKGYNLEMLDNDLKTKWKYETAKDSKEYEMFVIYDINEKIVLGTGVKRPGMMSKKMTFYITAFDIESGKKILEIPVESAGTGDQLSMNTVGYDSVKSQIVAVGDYYAEKDKPGSSKSKGFYIKTFTLDGKEVTRKFYSWDKDVKSMMPSEAKESIEKGSMNFVHRVLRGKDGKYYMVCEQFTRSADALGIAGNVLGMLGGSGPGNSNVKVLVWNLLVFVLNPDLTLSEIKFYPKDKSVVSLPGGADMLGPGMQGMIVKYEGGFDYQFTQMTNDGNSFDVVYIDYDKEKGESTKRILGNIIISPDGKFNLDKIDISSKATSSFLYPAKPGYLMMVDYLKKEKTLGMKLIKLNY